MKSKKLGYLFAPCPKGLLYWGRDHEPDPKEVKQKLGSHAVAAIIYIYLRDHVSAEKGYAYPSFRRMHRHLRLDPKTIRKGISWLQSKGWLSIKHGPARQGRRPRNHYFLTVLPEVKVPPLPEGRIPSGSQPGGRIPSVQGDGIPLPEGKVPSSQGDGIPQSKNELKKKEMIKEVVVVVDLPLEGGAAALKGEQPQRQQEGNKFIKEQKKSLEEERGREGKSQTALDPQGSCLAVKGMKSSPPPSSPDLKALEAGFFAILDEVCYRVRAERALPQQYGPIASEWASKGLSLDWANSIKDQVIERGIQILRKPDGYLSPKLVQMLFEAKVPGATRDKVRADFQKGRDGDELFTQYQNLKDDLTGASSIYDEFEAGFGSDEKFLGLIKGHGLCAIGMWLLRNKGLSESETKQHLGKTLSCSTDPEYIARIRKECRGQAYTDRQKAECCTRIRSWLDTVKKMIDHSAPDPETTIFINVRKFIDRGGDIDAKIKEQEATLKANADRSLFNTLMFPDFEKSVDEFFDGIKIVPALESAQEAIDFL